MKNLCTVCLITILVSVLIFWFAGIQPTQIAGLIRF